MQTTNCSTCKWWDPLLDEKGYCRLTETTVEEGIPKHAMSKAVAVTPNRSEAFLLTHRTFCCNQFSRGMECVPPGGGTAQAGTLAPPEQIKEAKDEVHSETETTARD